MQFLIDECVLMETTLLLRDNGFSVVTIQELGKESAANGAVIEMATQQKAILITTDIGIANIKRYPIHSHRGVILLRPRDETPQAIAEVHSVLLKVLKEVPIPELTHFVITIDRKRYRIRK